MKLEKEQHLFLQFQKIGHREGNSIKKESEKFVNLLIIEDNPGDVRLIEEILKEFNNGSFKLYNRSNLLSQESIELNLLDLSLSDSSGLDTLRTMISCTSKIPIIVLSVWALIKRIMKLSFGNLEKLIAIEQITFPEQG